jgi:hypothetical protein
MQIAQKAARRIDMLNIRRLFVATVLFTALQSSPRDVIVAAAFPDSKLPRCRNAEVPGVKPQPDLTEADHCPSGSSLSVGTTAIGEPFS